jgi:hypothetical protein
VGAALGNRTPDLRRASNTGVIMVAGQKITIDLGGDDSRTVRRTTTQPVHSIKAYQPRKAAHVS